MARPKSSIEEVDLIRWFWLHYATDKLRMQRNERKRQVYPFRSATVWGMHQFDIRCIHAALVGKDPPNYGNWHKEGTMDVCEVVKGIMAIARDKKSTSGEKERAWKKIRDWQMLIAQSHDDFAGERGQVPNPQQADEDDAPDPFDDPARYEG